MLTCHKTIFSDTLFSVLPFEHESVLKRIRSLIAEFEEPTGDVDADKALRLLLAQDLRKVERMFQARHMHNPEDSLPSYREKYVKLLRGFGLKFSDPKLFIVDKFPKPYDEMDWTATSPDLADQRDYGIEPGNYFKRKHLIPYRSDFLLAHEIIHHIVGEVDPNWLGRGLEEGIAVVFGELYVGSKTINSKLARIYTEYHWLDFGATQLKKTYTDYARQAAYIYKRFGLEGILALIRGGRPKIKEVEEACSSGSFDSINLPSGGWDEVYTNLLDSITMTYIRNLVVSPLAKYVAQYVEIGDTIDKVAEKAHAKRDLVIGALEELQHKTFLVVVADSRIDYSDIGLVSRSGALRYDI